MLWVKAFHIIFMVSWFAGLLYLPRLFVYHVEATDEVGLARFQVMERRLLGIMNIGMTGTLVFGVWLMAGWWWPPAPWLLAKLGLVILLAGYHEWLRAVARQLRDNPQRYSSRFMRVMNEVPAITLIAIVILVVVKPG